MKVIFYNSKCSFNTVQKELIDGYEMDIKLKRDTDIIYPNLMIRQVEGFDVRNYNYCHIPDLDRYYFIDRIESINNFIFSLSCRCDVLMTYQEQILNSKCLMYRGIKTGDYVSASIIESYDREIEKIESDKGFSGDSSYILSTVGVSK